MKTRVQPQRKTPTVELGVAGLRIPIHSHIAYLWETEKDFAAAVGFLEAGFRGSDYCVVIGDRRDNDRVLALLEDRGVDVEGFKVRKRLSILKRSSSARRTLKRASATFEAALAAGAPVVRLFGNVGWGRESETPDAELLSYEARLTEMAERFPSVILCLHEVHSMTGLIMRHGVLGRHPQTLEEGRVLGNPYFVPLDRFLERIGAIRGDLAERQQDMAERKRAEAALQRSYEELRALSARLRAVREEESARMARAVHDEVGQLLTALRLDVAWLEQHLEPSSGGASSRTARKEVSGKLQSMAVLLDAAVEEVQRIAAELRPIVLDELGLEAAIEGYVEEFQSRTGISCRLQTSLGGATLDSDRSTALFRILQEALTNVARHAGATAVDVRLAAEADRLVLSVTDNGRGVPQDKVADSRSLGLLGMRERARSLGGDLGVRRNPGGGTTVEASLPP